VLDEGRAREHGSDSLALNADAFAVDDSHAAEAFASSLAQILLDNRAHLARPDGVKVEHVAYLKAHGLGERVERVYLALALFRRSLFRRARRAARPTEESL
jgi:hypothetical protein